MTPSNSGYSGYKKFYSLLNYYVTHPLHLATLYHPITPLIVPYTPANTPPHPTAIQMTGMHEYSLMHSSLCTGFAVTTIIWTVGSTSGGLIDPAITLSAFSLGRIPLVRCIG